MKEIGGYIELDTYTGNMLHEDGIKLNCGRNALAYLIKTKNIKKIWMPKFMCNSCDNILKTQNVWVKYYSIGKNFEPIEIKREKDEWLYIVNYYGQLNKEKIKSYGNNIICDNAQAYFEEPLDQVDTIYTCRKFFGVADGAILYTDRWIENLPQDESFERMHYLLGRYERSASEFYKEYVNNNINFFNEPIKKMSKLTENFLHGVNYDFVKNCRTENFIYLHKHLSGVNKLNIIVPEGAFMYPLYIDNGAKIRKKLQMKKVYVPTLWPDVFERCDENELEYDMAENILPLPIDQRYNIETMKYLLKILTEVIF